MKNLKRWLIFGIIFIVVLGTLAHFIYEWTNYNSIVGIFVATNESTWEHIKLAIFPSLILMIMQYYFLRKNNNFFLGTFLSILTMIIFIPLFFYGYQLITKDSLFLDILDFILSVIVGQLIFYKIMKSKEVSKKYRIYSIIGLIFIMVSYLSFTYYPPKNFLFKDPVTSSYGINTGTKYINLNEEVILKKSETAKIKDKNIYVTITGFVNSPCPKGAQCFWSGLAVLYDFYVDGKKVTNAESQYKVTIIKSNYKTYARLKIEKTTT